MNHRLVTIAFVLGCLSDCELRSLDYLTNGGSRDAFSETFPRSDALPRLDASCEPQDALPAAVDVQEGADVVDGLGQVPVDSQGDLGGSFDFAADAFADERVPVEASRDLASSTDASDVSHDLAVEASGEAPRDIAPMLPDASDGSVVGKDAGMTYGIVGQSCGDGLACPGKTSCCYQIEVPTGSYPMGTKDDPDRSDDEQPEHYAVISRFALDKYEVTVGRFRKFAQAFDGTPPPAGAGALPGQPDSGWSVTFNKNLPATAQDLLTQINCDSKYQSWTTSAGAHESLPMNCVDWYVAFAFCAWDGGRLPTEAEWVDAAANGAADTPFPWGSADLDPTVNAVAACLGDGVAGCAPSDLLPVGSRPEGANRLGHFDLAGSLYEWCLDVYDPTYYKSTAMCSNCACLAGTSPRVIRGGDFTSPSTLVRATDRAHQLPEAADPYLGFRCARSP
jgi:sulfatase modifying factor 1